MEITRTYNIYYLHYTGSIILLDTFHLPVQTDLVF